jgi:ketosteroid isomerase-like protein
MRRVCAFLVATLFIAPYSFSRDVANSDSDEQMLRKIEIETARLEQQNSPTIEKFLSDDWVCAGPTKILFKKEFIENVKRNFATHDTGINPYSIEKRNIQVHVFGDTAVVTYVKEYRQATDMSKGFQEDDTDVFTRTLSGWRLRFTKISPVPPQSAAN